MIKKPIDVSNIKIAVNNCLNKEVQVIVNIGRNKFVKYNGVVTHVYPAIFTVKPLDDFKGRTCYSFFDICCGDVKIKAI